VFLPAQNLVAYIDHYHFLDIIINENIEGSYCTFPTGRCVMVVFYSAELPVFTLKCQTLIELRSFLSGYLIDGIRINKTGRFKCVIIKFTPLGSYHLFGIPPVKYIISFVSTDDIIGNIGSELIERINTAKSEAEIKNQLNRFFSLLLNKISHKVTLTEQIIQTIIAKQGIIRVEQIAKDYNMSIKKADRYFNSLLGIPPKIYAWLIRLNLAYYYLLLRSDFEISDVVFTLGFYDQSHMIRNFLRYAELTPYDLYSSSIKTDIIKALMTSPVSKLLKVY
jgi:AraC-like DNA-binding protein